MYCENCGKKLNDKANFCSACGTEKHEDAETPKKERRLHQEAKCWSVFANIGLALGIIGLATSWFVLGMLFAPDGIVFSALGLHSKTHHTKASFGLALSIIGTVISYIAYIILLIVVD